jgi:hypothetical protein
MQKKPCVLKQNQNVITFSIERKKSVYKNSKSAFFKFFFTDNKAGIKKLQQKKIYVKKFASFVSNHFNQFFFFYVKYVPMYFV